MAHRSTSVNAGVGSHPHDVGYEMDSIEDPESDSRYPLADYSVETRGLSSISNSSTNYLYLRPSGSAQQERGVPSNIMPHFDVLGYDSSPARPPEPFEKMYLSEASRPRWDWVHGGLVPVSQDEGSNQQR